MALEATHCTSRSIVRRTLVPFCAEIISDCDPGISAPAAAAYEYLPALPEITEFILDSSPVAPTPSFLTNPMREAKSEPDG